MGRLFCVLSTKYSPRSPLILAQYKNDVLSNIVYFRVV